LLTKSATDSGQTARIVCRARATPNVTFTWSRESSVITNVATTTTLSPDHRNQHFSSTSKPTRSRTRSSTMSSIDAQQARQQAEFQAKYEIEPTVQLDLVTYQSVLLVSAVSSADFGHYECVARNELGFDAITITLNRTSAPDAPLALRVINITQTAVTLRWIPGFDGGIGQSFRIRYKNVKDDASFTYRDVFPVDVTAMSVANLMPDSEYTFAIMAWNELGQSQFTSDIVKAKTLKGEYQVFQLT